MATQSEISLQDTGNKPANAKQRKTRSRRTAAKAQSSGKQKSTAENESKPSSGTDIVPVMKLRAIDIVEEKAPRDKDRKTTGKPVEDLPEIISMPASQQADDAQQTKSEHINGTGPVTDHNVTDPELLELLEQLSATIDTANNVLDVAATVSEEESQAASSQGEMPVAANGAVAADTDNESEQDDGRGSDEASLAARFAQNAEQPPEKKSRIGFGMLANTALTGLIFAAGIAWVLHTNPWLLDENKGEQGKDSASLQNVAKIEPAKPPVRPKTKETVSLVKLQDPDSFTPPEDDPVPMESLAAPAPKQEMKVSKAEGTRGTPIPLEITLPSRSGETEISLMIQGVPDKAGLSAGKELGNGNWLLNESDLKGLALTTPSDVKPGTYELEVILVSSDGSVPQSHKTPVVIKAGGRLMQASTVPTGSVENETAPVKTAGPDKLPAAQSDPQPVAATPAPEVAIVEPLSPQEIQTLLARGDTLLREGDVSGARLLLEYAAQRGSKKAMLKLGNSYDPQHLAKLGVRGVLPNEEKATFWYDRASGSGAAQ